MSTPRSSTPPPPTNTTSASNISSPLQSNMNSPSPSHSSTERIHTTPKVRIDTILSGARARKLAMSSTPNSEIGPLDTSEQSADENTSIINRQRSRGELNYQSTGTASWPEGGLNRVGSGGQAKGSRSSSKGSRKGVRSRPSTQSIRRAGRVVTGGEREAQDGVGGDEHESWWARLISEYGSIELENKGSVARDHLALERTFLAWLRTSLAFASIGIAITQLFRLNTTSASPSPGGADPYAHLRQMGKPLGATFLGISIVMLFVGFNRYFQSQHWIIRGKFPASRGSIAFVAAVTFALMVTSLVIVITVEPGQWEKK